MNLPLRPALSGASLLVLLGASCTAVLASCVGPESVRVSNREKLTKLRVGQREGEVLEIMGTETVAPKWWYDSSAKFEPITNPWRTESYPTSEGANIRVLFYYTEVKSQDDAITDDELTPLVLREEVLIGWGWLFWESTAKRYQIKILER